MYSYICLTYVCRILQVLSGLPLIFIICTLMYCSTPNYNSTATETAESQIIGTLFKGSRPYSSVILVFNSKRTMSTSSKPVSPARVYLNPDKEKESIVNENKGRTGIYR
jgi:hypothetical protein